VIDVAEFNRKAVHLADVAVPPARSGGPLSIKTEPPEELLEAVKSLKTFKSQ